MLRVSREKQGDTGQRRGQGSGGQRRGQGSGGQRKGQGSGWHWSLSANWKAKSTHNSV